MDNDIQVMNMYFNYNILNILTIKNNTNSFKHNLKKVSSQI